MLYFVLFVVLWCWTIPRDYMGYNSVWSPSMYLYSDTTYNRYKNTSWRIMQLMFRKHAKKGSNISKISPTKQNNRFKNAKVSWNVTAC